MAPEQCPARGGTRELGVPLDFQLGAGDGDFKVASAKAGRKASNSAGCPWHDVGKEAATAKMTSVSTMRSSIV